MQAETIAGITSYIMVILIGKQKRDSESPWDVLLNNDNKALHHETEDGERQLGRLEGYTIKTHTSADEENGKAVVSAASQFRELNRATRPALQSEADDIKSEQAQEHEARRDQLRREIAEQNPARSHSSREMGGVRSHAEKGEGVDGG